MALSGLNEAAKYATTLSSFGIRIGAFVFLRWPFPPALMTLLAVYIPSFIYTLLHTSPWSIVQDEVDIVAKDVVDPVDAARDVDGRYIDSDTDDVPGKELDVVETLTLEEKDPRSLRTLLTGLPSPSSLLASAVTFVVNLALVAMVFDLVYRTTLFHPAHELSMARVGYVSDKAAKVLVREPNASNMPVYASYRYADQPLDGYGGTHDSSWKSAGSIDWLGESTDFTGTFDLTGLRSDTRYQWVVSSNHSGFFITAPRAGQTSTRADTPGVFTFLHSSCLKNNFPYSLFAHPLSNKGLRYLADRIHDLKAQFMLFLGDFIYIDVPHQHGTTAEDYRREYRQIYASPDWPPATRELPWIHVYDDHEVRNDWDGNTTGVFGAAYDPYQNYHTSVNPPEHRKGQSYFSFTHGPATFFMLDTRRYRSPNDATNGSDPVTGDATKTLLGAEQLQDLLAWLKRGEPAGVKWKIVVSSIPFTKNWWFGAQDTWRGYLGERQIILEAMWDVGLKGGVGVIVLSGDRHEFAATAFPPPPEGKEEIVGLRANNVDPLHPRAQVLEPYGQATLRTRRKRWPLSATVHEFSASPMNMFYLPIRTYSESSTSDEYISDVCIKYIPDGNSKFGAVSISNPKTSDQSVLHYRLFVDGKETWSYTLTTPPDVGGGERSKDAIWG
ncbi:PhoD-like phosphatase [Teratosphaeria destructans]|uniref:PhoD-like phosphatase n=1 Tax=Teratosphaeria destructans TaxID=418781 RepID=A0A9W7W5P5_9PEZI|nr:PhoD-like phosphatase [Teratosphaeria destructans]